MMLAEPWDGEPLVGDWIAEPKLDGYRAVIVVDENGDSTVISRGNKEFWNWEHIAAEIKSMGFANAVFDTEFFAGNFGLTGSICKTQSVHPDRLKLKCFIFDLLGVDEWKGMKCDRLLRYRKTQLDNLFRGTPPTYLVPLLGEKVNGHLAEIADKFYMQGFEGIVAKNMDTPYVFDRSSSWVKVKPENDADVKITGVEEGSNKNKGRLGAFWVRGTVTYKKKTYDIISKVGGGLSDTQRDEFWKQNQEGKLVGTVIEVTYQDVTTEICGGQAVPSLRFPRFKRVRWDRSPIEMTQ
jgi:DNA ligase-1